MFVALVRFPKIKKEQDKEFREWFNWSTAKEISWVHFA